jgi:2-keto-4-pentenoate hydratase
MAFDEQATIATFWDARARGDYFPADWFDRLTLDQAYRIQLGITARRCQAGERQIGWKVGLTAKAIQQQFGFHEPVFGCILEQTRSGHEFGPAELIQPGFESELCIKLKRPLSGKVSLETVRDAVDVCHPALEIIETRGDLVKQIALAMADNAQQKTIVLGEPVALPPTLALEKVEARVQINGVEVATGLGEAVLGNPLNSIVWLSGKLGEFGRGLEAGDLIMTGSFTRQFPIAPGDHVRTDFSGIGAVEASMSK